MPATATEFAYLSSLFGAAQATALVSYIDAKTGPLVTNDQNLLAQINAILTPRSMNFVARSLDTDFIVHPTRDAIGFYNVVLFAPASVLGLQTEFADVQMLINGVAAPLEKQTGLTATLALSTSIQPKNYLVLASPIPAGSTVRLASSTSTNGTATLITPSVEYLL